MAEKVTQESIRELLKGVPYPGYSRDIVSFGIIKDVQIQGCAVTVALEIATPDPKVMEQLTTSIKAAVQEAHPKFTAEVAIRSAAPAGHRHPHEGTPQPQGLPEVKHLIAVASGKGGVGKSTVATNLACALADLGYATGLLDSDIYGPSIPLMMGAHDKPETAGRKIKPLQAHGVKLMSIGLILGRDDDALIWRGPMVMKALTQFLRDVDWGALVFLVIDLPPGTGDAQLTLVQTVALSGAVVVTTPQEVALLDVRKAVTMFRKVHCPILGVVENMSAFVCPHCHQESPIFAAGGGTRESERQDVPFLGSIPLHPAIREGGDAGTPIVVAAPAEDPVRTAFTAVARSLAGTLLGEEAPPAAGGKKKRFSLFGR